MGVLSQEQNVHINQVLWDYYWLIYGALEQRLKSEIPKPAKLYEILAPEFEIQDGKVLFKFSVVVDVTDITSDFRPCIWYEDVEYHCGTWLSEGGEEAEICDPESEKYDEDKCNELFNKCVQEEIKDFVEQHSGLPFKLRFDNGADIEAHLENKAIEERDKVCVYDFLVVTYKWAPSIDYISVLARDLRNRKVNIDYDIGRIVDYVKALVEVVKVLAP